VRWLLVPLFVILVAASCRCDATRSRSELIDGYVTTALLPQGPGVAVAVIRSGEVVHRSGYGFADVEAKQPVTPETVFDLASIAKQMTGMSVLVLRERGQLRLEDELRTHLPELPEYESERQPRIDDLSRMSSGLPTFIAADDAPVPTEASMLEWFAKQGELDFEPGETFSYNNGNYFLLARVVERVAKKPFAAFLTEEVLRPAGMNTAVVLDSKDTVVPNRAQGYARGKPARWDDGITGPANVFASLDDMIAWDRALWSGKLVPVETLARALEPARLSDGRPLGYALGWGLTEHLGRRMAWQDGDWIGASTYIARYLDDALTVILLSNGTRVPLEEASRTIAAMYLEPGR